MSISLCRRISMALVVCICASFCLLPFRAAAGQAEIDNLAEPVLAQWRRLNSILPTDKEHAAQVLKTLFIQYDVDASFSSVAVEDLEGVAKTFSQIGISAVFKEVALPSGGYGWVLQCDSIESFPVNIYGLYAPGGRIIYSPTVEEDNSAATSSRPSYTAPSTNVDIEYIQVFDSTTNTWVDVEINKYDQSVTNNTTNNNHYWDVDNRQFWDVENNTYTTYNDIIYNPSTQTYNVQFSDNRSYTYQFYYDYTYITYIGSSAEYREAYKVYYELPDGRSSGDLTVDELKGISLQFDMVNYDKAASDTMTRALYDFDGDLDNSSAFNSSAQWFAGASTTYLDAPDGFGGALFNNNPFDLRFSLDGVSNEAYTIQFRLYFENLPTSDFYVYAYGNPWWFLIPSSDSTPAKNFGLLSYTMNLPDVCMPFLRINQGNVYFAYGSSPVASIQPGQWYDFAICFDWSTYFSSFVPTSLNALYLYINGLLSGVGSLRSITYHSYYVASSSPYYYMETGLRRYSNDFTYFSFSGQDYLSITMPGSAIVGGTTSAYGYSNFWADTSLWRSNYSYQLRSASGVGHNGGDFIPPFDFSSIGFKCDGSYTMMLDNLRVVNHSLYPGVSSFTPTPVPFTSNLVYVLPSVVDLNDNTVAIMSQLPVTGYRVGGIRPTDPTLAAGYVWMHIDGEFVDSVQQYNGSYWEEVTARLYTGVRWIPVTAFNVFTLEDMFDIVDPDGDGGGESVSTIYQYYLWWSGEWGTFQQWLQVTMETLIEAIQNSGSGGSGGPVTIVPGYNDQTTTNEITTENPDGSTTVTTIVSNAAGLVYSRSVTTWPPDAEGNVSSIEIYTDSSGVSFRTEIQVDKDGHVTIIDPSEATGTLGGFLTMIAQGVMSIATSVIQAFVDLLVEVVEFVLDSVSLIFAGIVNILASLLSALAGFGAQIGTAAEFIGAFYSILPGPIQAGFTLLFVGGVSLGLFRLIHF